MIEDISHGFLKNLKSWSPLVIAPLVACYFKSEMPAWIFMWVLSFTIFAGLKWLTFADFISKQLPANRPSLQHSFIYLICWPGMDARGFFSLSENNTAETNPALDQREWFVASLKMLAGGFLFFVSMPLFYPEHPVITGWLSMTGIVMMLHFGLFHLLSLFWQSKGFNAIPLMNEPLFSWSLGNFWGQRWNLAFRDLANQYVFKKTVRNWGIKGASFAVFVVSGVVHDVVISIPSGGAWGFPSLYFIIQGMGVLFERSVLGKKLKLGKGWTGKTFAFTVLILPLPLLFHSYFIENIIIPMQISINPLLSGK
jgi:Membrane bound O-acyl transferase family